MTDEEEGSARVSPGHADLPRRPQKQHTTQEEMEAYGNYSNNTTQR